MATDLFKNHQIMLEDNVRMKAYRSAIAKVIKKGDVVVDIGCGLGILGMMALKAGARKVYAIEAEPETIYFAKLIAEQNGFGKKIRFINGLSSQVRIPEKADIILSEILGNIAFNENIIPAIIDARRRFLKPGGRLLPISVDLTMAPVEFKPWLNTVKSLTNIEGMNFLPDDPSIALGIASEEIGLDSLAAEPARIFSVDLQKQTSPDIENGVVFNIERDITLSGFAGWFNAQLVDGVYISTAPDRPLTHWKQAFLPLRRPIKVKAGSQIEFVLRIEPDQIPFGPHSIIGYNFEIL